MYSLYYVCIYIYIYIHTRRPTSGALSRKRKPELGVEVSVVAVSYGAGSLSTGSHRTDPPPHALCGFAARKTRNRPNKQVSLCADTVD